MRDELEALGPRLHQWVRRWWAGRAGAAGAILDALLWPAEQGFRGAVRLRNRAYDRGRLRSERAEIPVISTGNIAVGGAGKTPFTAWLAGMLAEWDCAPAVVLRGYGGDEVLLHRELNPAVPVFAAARRIDAVREATRAGCRVAVLDDAFQHRSLARDLDILLIAAESWNEQRRLLPRGPWREDLRATTRADLVVVTRKGKDPEPAARLRNALVERLGSVSVSECSIRPAALSPLHGRGDARPLDWLVDRDVLGVAGLAEPEPFADNLREAGARAELLAFPDHHPFSAADAALILNHAAGRPIITTHKDAVKLRPLLATSTHIWILEQQIRIEHGEARIEAAVRAVLREYGP